MDVVGAGTVPPWIDGLDPGDCGPATGDCGPYPGVCGPYICGGPKPNTGWPVPAISLAATNVAAWVVYTGT